jgi:hypothetical protein
MEATEDKTEPKLMPITFTEFVLPHGDKRERTVMRPLEIGLAAAVIIDYGWELQVELLRTGQISMTITSEDADELIRVLNVGATEADRDRAVDGLLLDGAEVVLARQKVEVTNTGDIAIDPEAPVRLQRPGALMTPAEAMIWSRRLAAYSAALRNAVIEADPDAQQDVEIL